MKRNLLRGFTLIELMIVVAIIAILAAIAIPQYQNYLIRSRWSQNLANVASYKLAIGECLQNNDQTLAACDTLLELQAGGFFEGATMPIVQNGTVTQTVATAALVIVGNAQAGTCTVTQTPTPVVGNVQWVSVTTGAGCTRAQTGV